MKLTGFGRGAGLRSNFFVIAALAFITLACGLPGGASADEPKLDQRLTPPLLAEIFPGATRFGQEEGKPAAMVAYNGDTVAGYVFSTLDVINAPGYSGVPFDQVAGIDLNGRITGAKMLYERESYIAGDAIREPLLNKFIESHAGVVLDGNNPHMLRPDYVSGASTSTRIMRAALFNAARLVLNSRSPRPVVTEPTMDIAGYQQLTYDQLVAEGSIVLHTIKSGDIADLLEKAGAKGATLPEPLGAPDDLYIQLVVSLATPAAIGRNLLGSGGYDDAVRRFGHDRQLFVVGSNGPYDFLGTNHYKAAMGHRFDRFNIVQGDQTFTLDESGFQRLNMVSVIDGMRQTQYLGIFALPANATFDPLKPWHINLLVNAQDESGVKTLSVPVDYQLPQSHILMPPVPPVPAWIEAWRDDQQRVTILGGALAVLTLILILQGRIARSRIAHRIVRTGFLLFTIIWIGWIAGAQLSVMNIVSYALEPLHHYGLEFYLAEPLMVIIAGYTLISLLIIGRGVFCGWLCPFGALQELLHNVARLLRLPQWNPSEKLQKRLWMGKYISAAIIVGLAFFSLDMSVTAAEVEPFKTAVTSHFTRAWPFIFYACALLGVGLFTERAYCRFLCPLGGLLALGDRLHLVTLLKRRPECGTRCHLCEHSCPVKAISRSGKINMAECFQCLDCQVEYYDDHRCPPLAFARKHKKPRTVVRPQAGAATALSKS